MLINQYGALTHEGYKTVVEAIDFTNLKALLKTLTPFERLAILRFLIYELDMIVLTENAKSEMDASGLTERDE